MFHEKDFHNLIEKQNSAEKEEAWKRLNGRLPERNSEVVLNNGATAKLVKRKTVIISVVATFIAVIVALAIILPLTLNKNEDPFGRYCRADDYIMEPSAQTLKEYSAENNKNWLYFDWYGESDYYDNTVYKLKTTNEVICFGETIFDNKTGDLISISVTDNNTGIDVLAEFENCIDIESFKDLSIKWHGSIYFSMATFEYEDYVYYLKINAPSDEKCAVEYAKLLLS